MVLYDILNFPHSSLTAQYLFHKIFYLKVFSDSSHVFIAGIYFMLVIYLTQRDPAVYLRVFAYIFRVRQ